MTRSPQASTLQDDRAGGPELIPIPAWPHPWPSQSAWRHFAFNAQRNGLLACGALLRAPGKRGRWLVDPARFWQWCREHGQDGGANANAHR